MRNNGSHAPFLINLGTLRPGHVYPVSVVPTTG